MNRFKYILIIIIISGMGLRAQTQLNNYLRIAAEQNPGLRAKYKTFEIAFEQIQQKASLQDPTLSFGYFISPVETRVGPQRFRLSLSQMFPWFGTLKTEENLNTKLAEATYSDFLEAKNTLFLKVKTKWLDLFELRHEIRITKENLEILKTYEPITKTKYEANLVSLADLVRVQIKTDEAKTQLKLLELRSTSIIADFNTLLHRDAETQVLTENVLPDEKQELSLDSALKHQPRIMATKLRIEAAGHQQTLSNLKAKPNIGLGMDYAFVGKRGDMNVADNGKDILMPMVSVSLPIFRKKNNASRKQAQLNQERLSLVLDQTEDELKNEWADAQYQIEKANTELALYDEEIQKTNLLLKVLTTEYSSNNANFEELLNTQQLLLELQLAQIKSSIDLKKALVTMEYLSATNLTSN